MRNTTLASSNVPGREYLYGTEKIAGVENTYEKQALAQNARQVELEGKSDQLRVHLSIAELAAETHKEKATEETSAASFAVFRPLPKFPGQRRGILASPRGFEPRYSP